MSKRDSDRMREREKYRKQGQKRDQLQRLCVFDIILHIKNDSRLNFIPVYFNSSNGYQSTIHEIISFASNHRSISLFAAAIESEPWIKFRKRSMPKSPRIVPCSG